MCHCSCCKNKEINKWKEERDAYINWLSEKGIVLNSYWETLVYEDKFKEENRRK